MLGGWANSTCQPLDCKRDKRPAGIPMIFSVAFLGEGEVYLLGSLYSCRSGPKETPNGGRGSHGLPGCL